MDSSVTWTIIYDEWDVDLSDQAAFVYYKNDNPDWAFYDLEIPAAAKQITLLFYGGNAV